jgi:hypothetical protein
MKIIPGVKPIVDKEVERAFYSLPLQGIFSRKDLWVDNRETQERFTDYHYQWIKSSELNHIHGLEKFPLRHMTNGCTESIGEYHWMFRDRRLRLYAGEYLFTSWLSLKDQFTYMHEDKLREGDALIMSAPFAHTGDLIEDYHTILQECTRLEIPVLIDCCFFGTCTGLDFSVDYDCVQGVCFSTSKTFATGTFRIGTLFCKTPTDHIGALNAFYYTPLLASKIHLEIMYQFGPDYMPSKYRESQLDICNQFDIQASPTMMVSNADRAFPDIDLKTFQGGTYAKGWPSFKVDGKETYRWGLAYALTECEVNV